MTDLTKERLLEMIAKEGLIEKSQLTDDAELDQLGLSSIDYISIIFAIEEACDVSLPEDAFTGCRTVGDMVQMLEREIRKQTA